jgi:hypothetical protein
LIRRATPLTTPDGALGAQLAALKSIFRPSSPVDDRELFRGRTDELSRIIGAVQELGQHAVIYGERGIGKTSLAYMARDSFRSAAPESSLAVRIPCSADDNFATVWAKLIPRVIAELDLMPDEIRNGISSSVERAKEILDSEQVSPEMVGRALHVLSSKLPLLIVIDEFDRIGDFGSTQLFADLIKTISDDLLRCTLVIVGVADDVDGLISGHRSVERALKQVMIPRMSPSEIEEIVVGGFATFEKRTGIKVELSKTVVAYIVQMSQGFPYYAHLIAGSVGEIALRNESRKINLVLLAQALGKALDESQQSIRNSYTKAVSSARKNAQFSQTLLACALAKVDELGFFAPVDICEPLSQLMGSRKETSDFLHRLHRFSDDPAWILETRGEGRRLRYRFANPLMKPFVLIKGVRDGLLTVEGKNVGFTIAGPK